MPAAKGIGGGQWGISWREVGQLIEDLEERCSCKLESSVLYLQYGKSNSGRRFVVATRAVAGRDGAYRLEGYAECAVGTSRGAASFPGAFVRSIADACEDLDRRRKDKRYDRDNPSPSRS